MHPCRPVYRINFEVATELIANGANTSFTQWTLVPGVWKAQGRGRVRGQPRGNALFPRDYLLEMPNCWPLRPGDRYDWFHWLVMVAMLPSSFFNLTVNFSL